MSPLPSSEVDVVIVAHNAGELLKASVESAVSQVGGAHVWVMDAQSTDGSTAHIEGIPADHLRVVPNAGFSASNNRGIELTSAPYVLLLNPDAILGDGAVESLRASAEANPRAAVVGAAVYNPDGSAQANSYGRFPTLVWAISMRLWRLVQRIIGNKRLSPRIPRKTRRVDWVTGACMLIRREAIDDAGLMDEKFFLYWEDVEWCHRMNDHGWEVLLEPTASVEHHLGVCTSPSPAVAAAYRESIDRYCDLYHLWGLKAFIGLGRSLRSVPGGVN